MKLDKNASYNKNALIKSRIIVFILSSLIFLVKANSNHLLAKNTITNSKTRELLLATTNCIDKNCLSCPTSTKQCNECFSSYVLYEGKCLSIDCIILR